MTSPIASVDPRTSRALLLPAVLVALGLASGGFLIGRGFTGMRTEDRTVSVKGVSERDAKADLAIWPLRLMASNDDLAQANTTLERNVQSVRAFLVNNQLDSAAAEVTVQEFVVQDQTSMGANGARYVIRQTIVVRSSRVDLVQQASQRVPELVRQGVVLSSGQEYGGGGPTFVFTKLNDFKPQMIAEATGRARESAEQFAKDSRSALSGIRTASQGFFEILPRDQAAGISEESQVNKRLRVVTTVTYGLR
jgi:hypothetical protein